MPRNIGRLSFTVISFLVITSSSASAQISEQLSQQQRRSILRSIPVKTSEFLQLQTHGTITDPRSAVLEALACKSEESQWLHESNIAFLEESPRHLKSYIASHPKTRSCRDIYSYRKRVFDKISILISDYLSEKQEDN